MEAVSSLLKGFKKAEVFDTTEYSGYITPEMALVMLEKNTNNRPIRHKSVNFLARQILAGNWVYNPQAIVAFDKRGQLLDGQHRLLAIVKANKAVPMKISLGNSTKAFAYIDDVIPKTLKDTFVKDKRKVPTEVLTFLKNVANFSNEYPEGQPVKDLIRGKIMVDNYEVMALFKNNALINKIIDHVWGLPKSPCITKAAAALTYWALCSKASFKEVDEFMRHLYLGEDVKAGTLYYTGRNRLSDLRYDKKASTAIQMNMSIAIWNAIKSGKESTRLRLPDIFPVIL